MRYWSILRRSFADHGQRIGGDNVMNSRLELLVQSVLKKPSDGSLLRELSQASIPEDIPIGLREELIDPSRAEPLLSAVRKAIKMDAGSPHGPRTLVWLNELGFVWPDELLASVVRTISPTSNVSELVLQYFTQWKRSRTADGLVGDSKFPIDAVIDVLGRDGLLAAAEEVFEEAVVQFRSVEKEARDLEWRNIQRAIYRARAINRNYNGALKLVAGWGKDIPREAFLEAIAMQSGLENATIVRNRMESVGWSSGEEAEVCLLKACFNASETENVTRIASELSPTNSDGIAAAMTSLRSMGQIEELQKLFARATTEDWRVWTEMLMAEALDVGDLVAAWRRKVLMEKKGMHVGPSVYRALLHALVNCGNMAGFMIVEREMRSKGLEWDPSLYHEIMEALRRNPKSYFDLGKLKDSGAEMTPTYLSLLNATAEVVPRQFIRHPGSDTLIPERQKSSKRSSMFRGNDATPTDSKP